MKYSIGSCRGQKLDDQVTLSIKIKGNRAHGS